MSNRFERKMNKHPWDKGSSETPARMVMEPENFMTDLLEREPIVAADDEDLRVGLARKAEALLGYSVLRKDAKVPGSLASALLKLGIEPFSNESVEGYKRKMLSAARKKNPKAVVLMETAKIKGTVPSDGTWGSLMRIQEPIFFTNNGLWFDRVGTSYIEIAWTESNLRGYGKPVPEFVLSRAVQIKNECPAANFFVEELKEQSRTLDPFLIARLDDEQFYIDVWDEPEFEKTLNQ